MNKSYTTREEWLIAATDIFRTGLFKRNELKIPKKIRLSVGFPWGARGRKAIGQHWHPKSSEDKSGQIFVSPVIGNGPDALGVLVHELVHAAVGNEAGHGPKFRRAALAVGLAGKMREATPAPPLKKDLEVLIKKTLGLYPHSKLNTGDSPRKKQTTRMIKMECAYCGYIARTALKNIEEHGPLLCPCTKTKMLVGK